MDDAADPLQPPSPTPLAPELELRTFSSFLESCGPDAAHYVSGLIIPTTSGSIALQTPEIELHCENEICNGLRRFESRQTHYVSGRLDYEFVRYICKNCGVTQKTFALAVAPEKGKAEGRVQKLGEYPPFGPPTPSRVMKLVGADRELFIKGRRAELRGLGIGAFAYYRRVVE